MLQRLQLLTLLALTLFTTNSFAQEQAQKPEKEGQPKQTLPASKEKKTKPKAEEAKLTPTPQVGRPQYDEKLFGGMRWRNVGPFRGGRVLAVTGVTGEPNVYYFGAVAGGVWKSTNGGRMWKPVFDQQGTSSIGSIAVADSDHNVIYVGTGEACIRGNISYGDGVYKSLDGGQHWQNLGLKDTRHIGAVIIHPKNPDIAFVAALGHAYAPNTERGIFRTRDGGKSWEKVLYVDDKSGGIDVVFDPKNPNVLFASTWQVVRTPYSLNSGGPGSGIYKSIDGGTTWKRLEGHGLPSGMWGRSGVTVSGGDSSRVYALIEAKEGGIYRSEDAGDTWTRVNEDERYRQRAWYFSHIFADPKSQDTVYVLNTGLFRSRDGGKTFDLLPAPHGDHHGFWIDPADTDRLINGNDGGATISVDGGKSWTSQDNQPTAQFYHVSADTHFPYRLYGAQQDNSTVAILNRTDDGYIGREHWYAVGGGESAYIQPDPRDPNIVYAGAEDGSVMRFDKRTEQQQDVAVWPVDVSGHGAGELKYRFQWTFPLLLSPHDPNTLYAAAQMIFKSNDEGKTWIPISPDLTRNEKSKQLPSGGPITLDITSVEYYDTVFTLAESPVRKDLLWAGTDDGLIHVTQDGGKNWSNVTSKSWPEWSMISIIEASQFDPNTAYVAIDDHRLDDFRPYIYKTTDLGKSWTRISDGIPDGAFVHAVRQDPKAKNILYAGTELGVYVSFNEGAHWQPLQLNLPRTPVTDLVVKENDLAVSTNGRSFWVLDDLSPLRELKPEITNADFILYQPAPVHRLYFPQDVDKRRPVGENPPNGAIISYYLKAEPKNEITLEISDQQGKLVRKYSSKEKKNKNEQPPEWPDLEKPPELLPTAAGMNRFPWNLRYDTPLELPGAFYAGNGPEGPIVLPGIYQLKLTVNGKSSVSQLEVQQDPRIKASMEDLRKQYELSSKVSQRIAELHAAVMQIRDARLQMERIGKRLEGDGKNQAVISAIQETEKNMAGIEQEMVQVKMKSSEGNLRYPNMLNESFDTFSHSIENDAAPTAAMLGVFEQLNSQLDAQLAAWKQVVTNDLHSLNAKIQGTDVSSIQVIQPAAE
jgi:photosystem II stability/assembly factor-like uncharacterized protein